MTGIETKRRRAARRRRSSRARYSSASSRLGFSAARTMRHAQSLYEGVNIPGEGPVGLITYMRTD
ncbi:MAG: DNA topoisomerase [Phycisphaerales bacterium]